MIVLFVKICSLLFFIGPISICIHEAGHTIGALIEKAHPVTLHIGKGKRLFQVHTKSVNLIIYRWYFLGGVTDFTRIMPYSRKHVILTALAGPLFNLAAAVVFISAYVFSGHYLLWCLFNIWLCFSNILPYKWRGNPSDGYLAWQAVRCRDDG